MISDVQIRPERGLRKKLPSRSGTIITIRDLQGDWDTGTFRRLIETQFKRIVDPFPSTKDKMKQWDPNEVFTFEFNGNRQDVPTIPQWLLEQAHALVTAEYNFNEDDIPYFLHR